MIYTLLPKSEWNRIAPIWKRYGSVPPIDDPFSLISVALNDDNIVGCVGLQSVLHLEGLWVAPVYSGKVDFRSLRKRITDALPAGTEFFALAPIDRVARICEYIGMQKKDWSVYGGRA